MGAAKNLRFDKRFSIANIIILASIVFISISAWFTLINDVRVLTDSNNKNESRINEQQIKMGYTERFIQQLIIETAIIKANQERQVKDIQEIKIDLKSIIGEIRK